MSEARDYRDTVFLPKTDFPMKAGLPAKEPGILARWNADGLYEKLREARAGREKFILHDGPPYANGDMHIGHALNHILKDMVCRTQSLLGRDAPYVPGWDCHGLPIEWKIEEEYRKKKRNKDEVPLAEFRAECRAYAQHWVDTQREQIRRLGVLGRWDKPYLTMAPESEATIVSELLKFAETGQLYRGAKPVMWSPVEKTALAEAEIEYEDIVSTQIDVAFEIVESPIPELVGAHAVIWTTTPWTIPVNQAIAYGPDEEYEIVSIDVAHSGDGPAPAIPLEFMNRWRGVRLLVVRQLVENLLARISKAAEAEFGEGYRVWASDTLPVGGRELAGAIARHPMHDLGGFFAKPRPFLPGDFVTTDSGTGLVHMAPDHGEDDFDLCKANSLDPQFAVEGDGKYRADWGWLGGQGSVINAKFNAPDGPICSDLREAGALLAASADYRHSYPHSWRSKAKVIYRCTPQWFVAMDRPLSPLAFGESTLSREGRGGSIVELPPSPPAGEGNASAASEGEGVPGHAAGIPPTLRELARAEIARVRFVPEKGRNRIGSMVESRPDWVLSRQRAWGVPIAIFVERATGQVLVDSEVNARIVAAVRERGIDAWNPDAWQTLLGNRYQLADYEPVTDIADVWFDSACTHAFCLESGDWPELKWPADLYLEGSDQHRGWFQSSLLESCATRGRAPYDAVLTHGFTMDAKGLKMSKSLGNTIDPLKVMETNGADIIRLWALTVDFTEDHRIGDEILKGVADQYRKLRNTFRYLLGALDGFDESERVADVAEMPELERYILHLLEEMDGKLRQAVVDYDFNTYVRLLSDFANNDLSAFFFDIRKDSLYCDAASSLKRRSYRTVLDILFHALVRYAAPVLVFTSEEVWGTRFPEAGSVHLLEWPEVDRKWQIDGLGYRWEMVRQVRAHVTASLEEDRREKRIGSSLEASPTMKFFRRAEFDIVQSLGEEMFAEICITSGFTLLPFELSEENAVGYSLTRSISKHHKCGRCWRHLPEVAEDGALCGRCAEVVGG